MTSQDREAIDRAAYLLRVVGQFIDENPVSDYSVIYDDASCDGACLRDDCAVAADELDHYCRLLAGAEAREADQPSLAGQLAAARAEVAKLAELVKEYLDPEEWKHENRSGWILCSGCGTQLDLGRHHAPDCKWVTRVKQAESPALAWLASRDARMKAMGAAEWLEQLAENCHFIGWPNWRMREEAAQLRQQAEAQRLAEKGE